jgi:penicillin amidase
MLVTANQNPFPEDYPYRVSGSFSSHYRSRQIEARLNERKGWKVEEMLGIQTDVYSAFSHFLARQVVKAWESRGRNNASLAEPAKLLSEWNGQMQASLPQPLLITLIYQKLRREIGDKASPGQGAVYDQQMAPVVIERLLRTRPKDWFTDYDALLVKCFDAAVQEGLPLYGSKVASWEYGKYTRFTLAHPVISRVPYVGKYFNIGPVPMHGASTTVKQTTQRVGPSMRFVADLSQWDNSLHNSTIGQSGQPFSKHFRDQWESYYAGRSFPMQFEKVAGVEVLEVRP